MAAVPDLMPVLGRGKHKNPARGACFMEYTSLLAGEPFSDAPACVDRELAAVLRQANDRLSDADRSRLVPLLGRAIGLGIPPPPASQWRTPRADAYDRVVVPYAQALVALHRRVSVRFLTAIGVAPTADEMRRCDDGREVDYLFWRMMQRPTRVRRQVYADRLIERVVLLHECYELAMEDLRLARHPALRPEAVPAPCPEAAPAPCPEAGPGQSPAVPTPRPPDPARP